MKKLQVALVGNPNSGKTAVFNILTGSNQEVGNWPGVTVEKKVGVFTHFDHQIEVIDLPGIYDAALNSADQALDGQITCQYLVSGQFDKIINVVDGSNLERNLYLTLQLLERGLVVIVVLNMMDIVKQRGYHIETKSLAKQLGCPVISMIARKKEGLKALKNSIVELQTPTSSLLEFPQALQNGILQLTELLKQTVSPKLTETLLKWRVLRYLEGDSSRLPANFLSQAQALIQRIVQALKEEPDIVIADLRYTKAHQLSQAVVQQSEKLNNFSQVIDRIVLNRYLGIPIFLFVMYAMFVFAINLGGAFQDFFDLSSATLFVEAPMKWLPYLGSPRWLTLLLISVGKGINTVVTFIPVIAAMFFFFGLLEDSGYMARAAFVMDRLMRALGLSGKSFVPMVVGLGCNVPAVMGTRTLDNHRDRILTVMMMPFMSCGARLAIFAVFASAFFEKSGAFIVFSLYCIGVLLALLTGFLLRKTILKGKPAPLVMELPSYHLPHLRSLLRQLGARLKGFVVGAGRFIIPICAVLSLLNELAPTGQWVQKEDHSILSVLGRNLTPLFSPLGIQADNWPATVGLITGVLAKEVVIGTLNTLYSEENHLKKASSPAFSIKEGLTKAVHSVTENLLKLPQALKNPIAATESSTAVEGSMYGMLSRAFLGKAGAFAYLLFILLYFPCVSTMAAMRREVGVKWTIFSVAWSGALAYVLATLFFQLLTFQLHPEDSLWWMAIMSVGLLMLFSGLVYYLRNFSYKRETSC